MRGTFAQQVFALQSLFRKQGACAETSSAVPLQPECAPPVAAASAVDSTVRLSASWQVGIVLESELQGKLCLPALDSLGVWCCRVCEECSARGAWDFGCDFACVFPILRQLVLSVCVAASVSRLVSLPCSSRIVRPLCNATLVLDCRHLSARVAGIRSNLEAHRPGCCRLQRVW